MRGAHGVERSIAVEQHWEKVNPADLHHRMQIVFRSIHVEAMGKGIARPTMYARMTFSVSGETSGFYVGSRSIGKKSTKSKLTYWFVRSGISYTLPGVSEHTEAMLDDAAEQIHEAHGSAGELDVENETSTHLVFFLEFVTCRAYQVNRQVLPS
jgi:hypothetical protein